MFLHFLEKIGLMDKCRDEQRSGSKRHSRVSLRQED